MLLDYLTGDMHAIFIKLCAILAMWGIVIVAVAIDLYFGLRKSKEMGDFKTHSYGLRLTVKKLLYYLALMAFMLLIDCLNPLGHYIELIKIMPIASPLGAIALVVTEFISVREKAEAKYVKRTTMVTNELIKLAIDNVEVMEKLKELIHKPDNN